MRFRRLDPLGAGVLVPDVHQAVPASLLAGTVLHDAVVVGQELSLSEPDIVVNEPQEVALGPL